MTTHALSAFGADALGLPAPSAVSAVVPLFLIVVLLVLRALPRLAALLGLLAGTALTAGWLHTVVSTVLGWLTATLNVITMTTAGGVVPGAVALLMAIYYVLQIRLDAETVDRLLAARSRAPARLGAVTGGGGRALAVRTRRVRPRRPQKLGALAVGVALPSVAATIPGNVGVVVNSTINVVGGLLAFALDNTLGIA